MSGGIRSTGCSGQEIMAEQVPRIVPGHDRLKLQRMDASREEGARMRAIEAHALPARVRLRNR